MTFTKIINTGLIGFGNAGQTFLGPFIHGHPGFYLKMISTGDNAKAALANSRYPEALVVNDAAAILNDKSIELVVIGTPNTSHLNLAKEALLKGKHVLVEKPFTITSKDADELIALAKKQNRIITVNHNRRFDSGHNTVKKVLASGMLGRVVEYEVHYDRFRPQLKPEAWREKNLPGSGILYDLGSHLIDGALDLFGTPHEVTAHLITQRPGLQVEDNFEVILNFANVKATLKAGMLVAQPGPVYTLYGDAGSFVKYGMDVQEEALKKGLKPEETPEWGVEPESIWGKITTNYKGLNMVATVQSEVGGYQGLFANLYEAISNQADLIIKPEQSRKVIRIIELAIQSNLEKRTIAYSE